MNMRLILTIVSIFCFVMATKAQVMNDTQHVKVVKEPRKVKLPQIINTDFCDRLQAISIPDTVSFFEEGQPKFYYITFEILFDNCGKVLFLKPGGNIKTIPSVIDQLKQLLETTQWKIQTAKKRLAIDFSCNLKDGKFKEVTLSTIDNFQREEICGGY